MIESFEDTLLLTIFYFIHNELIKQQFELQ